LHNMQTMASMRADKQVKIASETLYIYAPLAHRIGLYNIKSELEDLSLKYTEPEIFNNIQQKIAESKEGQDAYIQNFATIVDEGLTKEGLRANPTRMRDWISNPKSNGYECLHTTVMGPENHWVEVQIRSERMHEIAEKGYAAHYKYKNNGEKQDDNLEHWLDKLQEALVSEETNAVDFVQEFKMNLYAKEIFVFTPKGEIKSLPKGATALDFSFSIHTDIGLRTRGVRVNGKLAPLSQVLTSGDQVEIITSKQAKPTQQWLNFVTTGRARTKIKSSLNEERKRIELEGKDILRRKLKTQRIDLNEKSVNDLVRFCKLKTSNDLFYGVGTGAIDNQIIKHYASSRSNTFINFFKNKMRKSSLDTTPQTDEASNKYDLIVFGKDEEKLDYKFASCCNPIPGDSVFGFLTINEGIKIHKNNCPNAVQLQSNYAYRVMQAKWIDSSQQEFKTDLQLTGIDNMGLVNKVTQVISNNMNINIYSISFTSNGGVFEGKITVGVKNKRLLASIIQRLNNIQGIDKIYRN